MKVILPENVSEITLEQFQRYDKLNKRLEDEDITLREYNKRKVNLFAKIPYHSVDKVTQKDLVSVLELIDTALEKDAPFESRFMLNNIEFGFIPNLDEVTAGEFFDLNKYGTEIDTMHNLMAILFRPIVNKDKFKNYTIESYKGTKEYAEMMKHMPISLVNGALVFFCNLSRELQVYIQKFTDQVQAKGKEHQTFTENMDGTQPSMN